MVAACGTLQKVTCDVLGSLRFRCSKALAHGLRHVLRLLAFGTAAACSLAHPSAAVAADSAQLAQYPFAHHVAVGAQGLMQIMPATWAMLTARYGLGPDPYDVQANIFAGAAYLRLMWDRYRDVRLMLAAYNAGPGRTDGYVAGRRLPAETIEYVTRITASLGTASVAPRAAMPAVTASSWRGSGLFGSRPDISPVATHSAATTQTARTSEARPDAKHPLFFDIAGNSE
jgi:hypothetical protein